MNDLIDRQAAIDALYHVDEYNGRSVETIRNLPPVQKKGHWIDEGTNYLCSECHRGCWVNSDYCPWCGADMRGEEDE